MKVLFSKQNDTSSELLNLLCDFFKEHKTDISFKRTSFDVN